MEQEKLELFDDLNTCITGAEQGLKNLTISFEDITNPFKRLNGISDFPTNYKCPQCGNVLYIHNITETDVIFYCKDCNEKVKGKI